MEVNRKHVGPMEEGRYSFEHGCVQKLGDSHVVVPPPRYDVQGLGFDTLLNG